MTGTKTSAPVWRLYSRCDECGVDAGTACRDEDDTIADDLCFGRKLRASSDQRPIAVVGDAEALLWWLQENAERRGDRWFQNGRRVVAGNHEAKFRGMAFSKVHTLRGAVASAVEAATGRLSP